MKTNGLELLEQKIRKAAEMIRTLREERGSLERRLEDRESEIKELQSKLAAVPEEPEEDLGPEMERLREERSEMLARVDRMLALIDELDEAGETAGEPGLLAAVDGVE